MKPDFMSRIEEVLNRTCIDKSIVDILKYEINEEHCKAITHARDDAYNAGYDDGYDDGYNNLLR